MAVSQRACSLRSSSAGATDWRAGYFLLFPSQNLKGQRGCWETAKKLDRYTFRSKPRRQYTSTESCPRRQESLAVSLCKILQHDRNCVIHVIKTFCQILSLIHRFLDFAVKKARAPFLWRSKRRTTKVFTDLTSSIQAYTEATKSSNQTAGKERLFCNGRICQTTLQRQKVCLLGSGLKWFWVIYRLLYTLRHH